MSVQDGQNVNAAVTNAALMSRLNNTSTIGRVDVNNTTDSTDPTTGAIHTTGGLGVEQNANIGLSLGVTQNAVIGGNLDVGLLSNLNTVNATTVTATGTIQGNDVTATDVLTGNSLSVTTSAGIGTDLGVGGNATVTGNVGSATASTTGLSSPNSLAVTTSATVGTTLGVTGNTTLSTVSTTGLATLNSVQVTNNADVGGDLEVTGNVTVVGNLEVQGTTTTVNSTVVTVVDQNITLNNNGSDASSEGAGLTIDRTGTSGSLIYKDASASKWAAGPLGSEVDLVNVSGSQTLTNKTIDGSLNTITNVTANGFSGTLPIANGGTGQTTAVAAFDALAPTTTKGDLIVHNGTDNVRVPVGTDNLVLVADSTQAAGVRWGSGGGGGGGAVNLIQNGDAEANINIWTPYNDRIGVPAADRRPVDGLGGTPTVTSSVAFSQPINGSRYFYLQKPVGDCQGQGWSSPVIDIPLEYRGKSLKHYLAYLVDSGTFSASNGTTDGDVIVYFYDVSQAKVIESSNIQFRSSSTTVVDSQEGTFQPDILTLQVRMLIHVATQTTAAFNLKIDSVMLSPQTAIYGTPVTAPIAFTPSGTWTNATYTGEYYTVGKFNYYHIRVGLTGSPSGGVLNITLPHTIDTSDLATGTNEAALPFTSGTLFDNGSFFGECKAFYLNSTTVQIRSQSVGNAHIFGQVTPTTPVTFVIGDSLDVSFAVPIVGNSASLRLSEPGDTRPFSVSVGIAANQSIASATPTKISFGSIWRDSQGTVDATNNRVFVNSSNTYRIHGIINVDQTTLAFNGEIQLRVNGSIVKIQTDGKAGTSFTTTGLPFNFKQQLNARDYFEIWFVHGAGANLIIRSDAVASQLTVLHCERDQDSSQVLAQGETGYVNSNTSAGGIVQNGLYTFIDFNNKIEDNMGRVVGNGSGNNTNYLSTWRYVAAKSEFLEISSTVTVIVPSGVNIDCFAVIMVNGVEHARGTRIPYTIPVGPAPVASHVSGKVRLKDKDAVSIAFYQGSGANRNLEPGGGGNFVNIIARS